MPSIKDIARKAGVSHSTVSRALHNSPLIGPETAAKIRAIAKRFGYVPSAVARSLVSRTTRTVGVVVTTIADPFIGEVVEGIESMANEHRYSVILANSHADPELEIKVVDSFSERRVDGILVAASRVGALHGKRLAGTNVPIVLINNQHPGDFAHSVGIDNIAASRAIVTHLLELGHRRIAYIGDRLGYQSDTERFSGYRTALKSRRIPVRAELVVRGDGKPVEGERAAHQLFKLRHPPTAIFCYNDMTALGVLRSAADRGLRVPDDISVAAFDDLFVTSYTSPPLTTIRQPKQEMGRRAMSILVQLLKGEKPESRIKLPGELIIREARGHRYTGFSECLILKFPVFHRLERSIQQAFSAHIAVRYGVDIQVGLEQPRQSDFGELAVPAAFQLAKQLKQSPRKIAAELVSDVGPIPGVAAFEIAGNGYINIRFDRGAYASALLRDPGGSADPAPANEKIIVEHTNINPNKAAHIGHLRNAVLGDTFVRMLRSRGRRVEVQNYIDNTGVQVADVVAGFHFLARQSPAEVAALIAGQWLEGVQRFDYLCWDLYARTSQNYKDAPETLAWRAETLHSIEAGEGELFELAHLVADAIVQAHIKTMLRLGVEYDVLPRESEILHLKFWASAFELLKQSKAIYLEAEGKNAGCWVMPAQSFSSDENAEDSKVIVRSNGTVTYVGKDIAYQLWKFGLLGKDFYYRPLLSYPDGRELWVTTDQPQSAPTPAFGKGTRVYNVIDVRQSYLQEVVVAGLKALGAAAQAEQSIHFSYEMVALSPRCCADLGIELSEEDRKRPYVEVSGRKGLGVKADDLIDKLIESALVEVESRHPDDDAEKRRHVATQIAIGALRYFLLKFTRPTVIAFDFQEALSFEGETGPYVQYAAVRARNILRKMEDRGEKLPDFAAELSPEAFARQLASEDLWQVLLATSKAGSAVEKALTAGEPAHVAKYAFQLAQSFSNFYHEHNVLAEPDRERRIFLLWMTDFFRAQLENTLTILGIDVPEFM